MNELIVTNYSRYEREKRGYSIYPFCVFIDPKSESFNELHAVEYLLAPSFPDPTRRISDRNTCFALQSEAWGTFPIRIRAFKETGDILRATYTLTLNDDDWPMGRQPKEFADGDAEAVYATLFDDRYNWRKFSTIVKRSEIPEKRVREILDDLAGKRLAREAYFKSTDNDDLWGATAVIGLLPSPDAEGEEDGG